MQRALVVASTTLAVALLTGACGKSDSRAKAPPPEVTGLAAVPANAEVVVGADLSKLAGSRLVRLAVEQLFLRDRAFATRWSHVREACKLDLVKQVKRIMLALGPPPAGKPAGTGPVLMIATGDIAEADLTSCVRSMVGKGGGSLTAKPLGPRTLYQVKDANHTMVFAYSRPDTIVLGSDEAYVTAALSTAAKVTSSPTLNPLLKQVDQHAPLWAAGRVPAAVADGLVRATAGKLTAGPTGFIGTADPSAGATLELGGVMASSADARTLEGMAKAELALLVAAAQLKQLGGIVNQLRTSVDGTTVRFRLALSPADVNHVLSVLDGDKAPAQDAVPSGPP